MKNRAATLPPVETPTTVIPLCAPTTELVVVARNQHLTLNESVHRLHDYLSRNFGHRFPGQWVITIADIASTDNTMSVARELAASLPGVTARHITSEADNKSLRAHWSMSTAIVVAFLDITPATDLGGLIRPLVAHEGASPQAGDGAHGTDMAHRNIDRRAALAAMGGAGLMVFLAACGSSAKATATTTQSATTTLATTSPTSTASTTSTSSTAGASSTAPSSLPAGSVALTPELTEGPYYLDLNLVRSDITEGHVGAPLALRLAVLNAADGKPIKDATVDVWHTDGAGVYSGFVSSSQAGNGGGGNPPAGGGAPPAGLGGGASNGKGDGTTFCRGTQLSDAQGNVNFNTLYPGWYQGRAVHIHVKVHVGGKQIHTGQIFFDDTITDAVYAANLPYSTRGPRDLLNSDDGIFSQGGSATVVSPVASGAGYTAKLTMGVQAA